MKLKEQYIKEIESLIEIKYATNNKCYQENTKRKPSGVVVHSIGVAQPDADRVRNIMDSPTVKWGVNAIMNNKKIILCMPYDTRPWGCGYGKNGSYNNTHFQFEICEPSGHTYAGGTMLNYDVEKNKEWFNQMYTLLIKFLVYLCDKFNITADAICDHAESYKRGYGSNHSDTGHWFPKHGKSMDTVRDEVNAILNEPINNVINNEDDEEMTGEEIYNKLNEYLRSIPFEKLQDWAQKELIEAKELGITDGTRPFELIPRYQAAIMAKRAMKK